MIDRGITLSPAETGLENNICRRHREGHQSSVAERTNRRQLLL